MRIFRKIISVYKSKGVGGLVSWSWRRLLHPPPRARCYRFSKKNLSGAIGLEIGGPSDLFSRGSILPVYPVVGRLDNCNFASKTTWEPFIEEGMTFRFEEDRPMGRQYVSEATNLSSIPSAEYDFILSSHVIEHIANPLRALFEWKRVLKKNGFLVLIVPHLEGTFDRKRPLTTLDHIINDFERKTGEEDLTHLPEILGFYDLTQSPETGSFEEFSNRSRMNFENRCLHHHVFDTRLVAEILNRADFQIYAIEPFLPCHIIAIAQKKSSAHPPDNRRFTGKNPNYLRQSPFLRDQREYAD